MIDLETKDPVAIELPNDTVGWKDKAGRLFVTNRISSWIRVGSSRCVWIVVFNVKRHWLCEESGMAHNPRHRLFHFHPMSKKGALAEPKGGGGYSHNKASCLQRCKPMFRSCPGFQSTGVQATNPLAEKEYLFLARFVQLTLTVNCIALGTPCQELRVGEADDGSGHVELYVRIPSSNCTTSLHVPGGGAGMRSGRRALSKPLLERLSTLSWLLASELRGAGRMHL